MYSELRSSTSKDSLVDGKVLVDLASVLDGVDGERKSQNYSEIGFEGAIPLKNYHQIVQALKTEIRVPLVKESIPEDLNLFSIFQLPPLTISKDLPLNQYDSKSFDKKIMAQRRFVAGISRHYNNLLMGIQGYLSIISFSLGASHPYQPIIKSAEELVQSGSFAISLLLGYLAERRGQTRRIRFNHLVNEVAGLNSDIPGEKERQEFELWMKQISKFEGLAHITEKSVHSFERLIRSIVTWADWIRLSGDVDLITSDRLLKIKDLAEQGSWVSGKLLAFSGRGNFDSKILPLKDILKSCLVDLPEYHRNIRLRFFQRSPDISVSVDPGHFSQIFYELVQNALESMPDGGDLTISLKKLTLSANRSKWPFVKKGNYVQIKISDTGSGIEEALKDRVLDPFFTTKFGGKRLGLGLSMAYGVVRQLGGDIEIHSKPKVGSGTVVKLLLPRK